MSRRRGWSGGVAVACCVLMAGCGYSTRPGLPSNFRTVYIKPLLNKIDLTELGNDYQPFPIYRPGMETTLTSAIVSRFQFTGLLRPSSPGQADTRIEGELMEFRRDPLRFNASQQVEEWRLNVVANVRFYDQRNNALIWEEERMTGDTTYFALGTKAEGESAALDRAIQDFARRVVERSVENW